MQGKTPVMRVPDRRSVLQDRRSVLEDCRSVIEDSRSASPVAKLAPEFSATLILPLMLAFSLAALLSAPLSAQIQPSTVVTGQPDGAWQPQIIPGGAVRPQGTSSTPAQMSTPPGAANALPGSLNQASSSAAATNLPPSVLQQPAHRATIRLDPAGLYVKAENSNLSQILRDIASATGTKITGLAGEERIFGTYGPGQGDQVVNALLYGSDYNVLMVGSVLSGAPRELVLTRRSDATPAPVSAEPAARSDDDTDSGTAYEDPDAPPPANSFPPGQARLPLPPPQNAIPATSADEPVRTPQQLLEQLQQLHRQNDGQRTPQAPLTQP